MQISAALIRRVTATWAQDARAFADALAGIDPSWGSDTFDLAGGIAVLCGPGMYVNRALAAGQSAPLTDADWETLEARSIALGVPPAIEVTPATHPGVAATAAVRGYAVNGQQSALIRDTDPADLPAPDPRFEIVSARSERLAVWQETSAIGWGHVTPSARRASDDFVRAAAMVDGDGLVLAFDVASGEPVGCASLTLRAGLGTLGGMSTVPTARGRGVQAALITHRLRVAAAAGCAYASSMAAPGGASERNLMRHGFERAFTVETWVRPT